MLQAERIRVLNETLAGLWSEMEKGNIDSDVEIGLAVNAQINLNRIVYMLNKRDQALLKAEAWSYEMQQDAARYLSEGGEP